MAIEQCLIEDQSNRTVQPFISVRGNHMSLQLAAFNEPYNLFLADIDGPVRNIYDEKLDRYLASTCHYCKLCQPEINRPSKEKLTIDRNGYSIDKNSGEPFPYSLTTISPSNGQKVTGSVAIIEDNELAALQLAKFISETGKRVHTIVIRQRTNEATYTETASLITIILQRHVDTLITDKNIGPFSGYTIAEQIQEYRIIGETTPQVIMITGEPSTRELHKCGADRFFEKTMFTIPELITAIDNPIFRAHD